MPKFGVIFWCDFCRFTPQHAHASKAGIPETSVAATGFSWIERCSQKSRETHGMQGVRSSSLLGSIQETPGPAWVFQFLGLKPEPSRVAFGVICGVISLCRCEAT